MLENSQDVLNIVKAVATFAIAGLFSWVLFYVALIFKNIYSAVKDIKEGVHKFEEAMTLLKEKIEHSTSYLLIISEGVKKLVDVMRTYSDSKKEKNEEKE